MGKKKSVENDVNEKLLEEFSEMMKNIQGHYMSLVVSTAKMADKDWKAIGNMKVGSTLDGEHWGEIEMGVTGYDVNSDSALATVMVSLNNYINSPEFLVEMGSRMKKSLENEATIPDVLAE